MTSPNQTPDALREAIREALEEVSGYSMSRFVNMANLRDARVDHLLARIAPFLAPPLTPDASTTGTKDRVELVASIEFLGNRVITLETELASARAELAEAKASVESEKKRFADACRQELIDLRAQLATALRERDEEHERLIDFMAKASDWCHAHKDEKEKLEADLTALRAQVEEARKDGERLDWCPIETAATWPEGCAVVQRRRLGPDNYHYEVHGYHRPDWCDSAHKNFENHLVEYKFLRIDSARSAAKEAT